MPRLNPAIRLLHTSSSSTGNWQLPLALCFFERYSALFSTNLIALSHLPSDRRPAHIG